MIFCFTLHFISWNFSLRTKFAYPKIQFIWGKNKYFVFSPLFIYFHSKELVPQQSQVGTDEIIFFITV